MTNFAKIVDLGEAEALIRGFLPPGTEVDPLSFIETSAESSAEYLADFDNE
jgi:hypothetical protein